MGISTYPFLDSDSAIMLSGAGGRLRTLLGRKMAMALGLNLWALVPYYWLQHHRLFPVTVMPLAPVDEWIQFNDSAVWLYLSLFALMPVAPMQFLNTDQLRRYAIGVAGMSLIADLFFFFSPTAVLRPDVETTNLGYHYLTMFVSPANACPSLHASMAAFSALCYEQVAPHMRRQQLWRIVLWIWAVGVIYATLATKEHVSLDAAAGFLLGSATYFWAFRFKPSAAEHSAKRR
jgi:membrane-associated phospholipid phosphatase